MIELMLRNNFKNYWTKIFAKYLLNFINSSQVSQFQLNIKLVLSLPKSIFSDLKELAKFPFSMLSSVSPQPSKLIRIILSEWKQECPISFEISHWENW
jgi:hypothetical protein